MKQRAFLSLIVLASAVTMSAVLYVFRTLVGADIPLNAGCLKPLEVRIPEGSMLNPRYPAAVVAGNVETSQCVTDALYGVLGVMGASREQACWSLPMARRRASTAPTASTRT